MHERGGSTPNWKGMQMPNERTGRNKRNPESIRRNFPLGKRRVQIGLKREKREGTSISFDDVLDFHLWLQKVKGMELGDGNFFRKR